MHPIQWVKKLVKKLVKLVPNWSSTSKEFQPLAIASKLEVIRPSSGACCTHPNPIVRSYA